METKPHGGRPRGRPASGRAQEAVLAAAARLFAEHGYARTSIRDIAREAGVDPAIVMRHFGSKDALFLLVMRVDQGFHGITEGPLEGLGRRILARLVTADDAQDPREFAALVGALDRDEVREYLQRSAERHVIDPLAARLEGPEPELRARLISAQILGLMVALFTIEGPALKDAPIAHVLDLYAPAIQTLIDGP